MSNCEFCSGKQVDAGYVGDGIETMGMMLGQIFGARKSEKPVMCGCGGMPKSSHDVSYSDQFGLREKFFLSCENCGAMVSGNSADEAVEKWNKAMSGNRIRLHDVRFEEGEKPPAVPFRDDKNPKRWICGACGSAVKKPWKFCQNCGFKIDWSEKNE